MPLRFQLSPRAFLILLVGLPALAKLFVLAPLQLFEGHTIAVEWLTSGMFRYHHLGVWHASYQFPVYPALVTLLLWSGAGEVGALLFQVGCGAASAWLVYRLAQVVLTGRSYASTVAAWASVLTGVSPFLAVYQVHMVHPFAWDMLLALALLLGSFILRPESNVQLFGFSLLAGCALLNRPTLIVLVLPAVWMCRSYFFSVRAIGPKLVMLVLLLAPTTLWLLRNRAQEGHFQLSSATGQNLWIGIQEATQGTAQLPDGRPYTALLSAEDRVALAASDAYAQSVFFARKWREALRAEPGLWWRMMGVKLRNFWLYRTALGVDHSGAPRWVFDAFRVYAVLLFVLVLVAWGEERTRVLLVTLFLFSVAQALFYVETRHRLLVEPALMLIALAGIARSVTPWTRRGTV